MRGQHINWTSSWNVVGFSAIVAVLVLPAGIAQAQFEKKITASDGAVNDDFGSSWRGVGISGDTVIVEAPQIFAGGTGTAYIFERNQGGADNWGEVIQLNVPNEQRYLADPLCCGGSSVSISGDTAMVGAVGSNLSTGSAYIFYRDEGGPDNWGEVVKLTASDGRPGDRFGFGGLSGDTAIVAAVTDDDAALNSGAAYIFERNQGGANNWGEVTKLTASDAAAGDQFGAAGVAISGDTAIVGAMLSSGEAGSAYIFERNEGGPNNWSEVAKLTAPGGPDNFGISTAIWGDTAIVGAYPFTTSGIDSAAYIYERNQGGPDNWGEVTMLTPSDPPTNAFGWQVAISGDHAVVTAPADGVSIGAAYVFARDAGGPDNWGQILKLTPFDGENEDYFGSAVSVFNNTVVVGAWGDNSATGAAYIYRIPEPSSVLLTAIGMLGLLGCGWQRRS